MAKQVTLWRKLSIGAITGSIALSGCFSSGNKNVTSVKSNEKVTLTMWGLFDDPAVWKPIIDSYQVNNPNITINYVKKDFASYEADSFDALAARTGPDIWMIKNDWMARHYEKLSPAPDTLLATNNTKSLDAYKAGVPDVAYNNTVMDGKIYGIPLSVDSLVLYYNRDIFNKTLQNVQATGKTIPNNDLIMPPNTWADVIRYNGYLQQKDGSGNITRAGIALGANNVDQSQDILSAIMLQTGTQMVVADRKSAGFNLSRTVSSGKVTVPGNDALTFFRSFSDPANANYTWPTTFPNSIEAFEQGKTAMILGYGYLQNQLKQDAPTLNFGIGPLPQIEGATTATDYSSYWLETVTKASAHPDVAWDFLKSAYQQAGSYSSGSGRPSVKRPDSVSGPASVSARASTSGPTEYEKLTSQDWYKGRRPVEVDNIFHDLIAAVVGGDTIQHALDSAAKRVTDMLSNQTPAPQQ